MEEETWFRYNGKYEEREQAYAFEGGVELMTLVSAAEYSGLLEMCWEDYN